MKKITAILMLSSLLIPARQSLAQRQVGVMGGLSMAKVQVTGIDVKFGYRESFSVGGVFDIYLSDYASLYFQPRFIQKGGSLDGTFPLFGAVNGRATVSYLEVPVSLKIAYTEDTIQPYIYAGPTFGFLLSSKFEGTVDGSRFDEEVSEVTGGYDVGLGAGGGVGFVVGIATIFAEARYIFGYSDILEDGTIVIDGQAQNVGGIVENRSFELLAGIKFPLGE